MKHKVYLGIYILVSVIVGYHLRWMHTEINKYLDYKKPKEILCKGGIAYEQAEPYSMVYIKNENLTCMEK